MDNFEDVFNQKMQEQYNAEERKHQDERSKRALKARKELDRESNELNA